MFWYEFQEKELHQQFSNTEAVEFESFLDVVNE